MKTHNTDAVHQIDVTRGRKNTNRAGSQGISVLDGNGADIHPVTDILFSNATATDGDDGLAIIEIVGGSSSSNESWAQADGGLTGDGTTDDTTALQTLIDSCTVNGTQSCTIRFEPGTYLIAGALQDTGAFNGQILLPDNTGANEPLITLTFVGPARPQWGSGTYTPGDAGYAVLKSTRTGGTGTAAVFSGGNSITNKIQVVVRDLWCIAPDNPSLTFWNLSSTQDGVCDGLLIGTAGVWPGPASIAQPTNTNAYGIKLSDKDHSSASFLRGVHVIGFYKGFKYSELVYGNIQVWYCQIAAEPAVATQPGGSLTIEALGCEIGIQPSGSNYCDIYYFAEHAAAPSVATWMTSSYDLDDSSNHLKAHIRWFGVEQGVGADHIFTKNGGTNATHTEIGPTFSPGQGSTFPANPLANDSFFREDLSRTFVYNGTRWASEIQQVSTTTQHVGATTAYAPLNASQNGFFQFPVPALLGGSDIYIEGVHCTFIIVSGGSALSASHSWVGTFHKRPTGNTKTTIATFTINSGSSAVWRTDVQSVGALMNNGTTHFIFGVDWTKTGTPGDLWAFYTVTYRYVAT